VGFDAGDFLLEKYCRSFCVLTLVFCMAELARLLVEWDAANCVRVVAGSLTVCCFDLLDVFMAAVDNVSLCKLDSVLSKLGGGEMNASLSVPLFSVFDFCGVGFTAVADFSGCVSPSALLAPFTASSADGVLQLSSLSPFRFPVIWLFFSSSF
jgi:hypothetical protein